MTIAYGIALQMGWSEPMWAGFTVAFVSLATVGQSMNKAALRMMGTFLAAAAALIIIALFPQDRWLFMLTLSLWAGFCTYMMGGPKNQYFWNVSAFACVIICMDGGLDPINAFNTAMLRTQETGLGILVYSLVAIFLWPVRTHAEFDKAIAKLVLTQQQLYQTYMNEMITREPGTDKPGNQVGQIKTLRAQLIQEQNLFVQLLNAAETDSDEVKEVRRQWHAVRDSVLDLNETMECWRDSFSDVQELDLQSLLPNLVVYSTEIDQRFLQLRRMLAGDAPEQKPQAIQLSPDITILADLSPFHKAALTNIMVRLKHLEQLTRLLFDSIADIKNVAGASVPVSKSPAPTRQFVLDTERLIAAGQVIITMWLAFLALIYVNNLPGGTSVVSVVTPLAMVLALNPQLSIWKLLVPASTSVAVASFLYIFVMPQLSSFLGLGLLIFAMTFSICYLFSQPQQMLGKAFGLALFLAITSITNEQSYSFLVVSTTTLMFSIVFILLAIMAYIPFSPQPQRAYLRLLGRFFRSSEYLLSTMSLERRQQQRWIHRWRKAFHTHELMSLPRKLATWSRFINTRALPGSSPEDVQKLNTSLQSLTYRLQNLLATHELAQSDALLAALLTDIHAWQLKVQSTLSRLAENPESGEREMFRARLNEIIEHMEIRIKETLNTVSGRQNTPEDSENFYRLIGAYRGVSEALVDYAGNAQGINWSRWREERF